MAAGWARRVGGAGLEVISGGSDPADDVNPTVIAAMAEAGIHLADESPSRWNDTDIRSADAVVTMGCGDTCPVFPGVIYEDWEITDPSGLNLPAVRRICDEIHERVEDLLSRLGVREA